MKEDQTDRSLVHMDLLELPHWNYKGGLAISHHHHLLRILKEEYERAYYGSTFFEEFKNHWEK